MYLVDLKVVSNTFPSNTKFPLAAVSLYKIQLPKLSLFTFIAMLLFVFETVAGLPAMIRVRIAPSCLYKLIESVFPVLPPN